MPYTGTVLAILAAHAAVFLILLGHWVVAAGMFPKATRSFAEVYDQRSLRATFVGIITFGPIFLVFLQNAKIHSGTARVAVFVLAFGALLLALIGGSGLALRIGRNLSSTGDAWQQVLRGSVMLALVCVTPLLGWFLVLPVALASGFGAFLLARPWKSSSPVAPPASDVVPPISGSAAVLS